mmetsp:Transcript_10364/g.30065  ORF Transcript_10364/g.30065 Transcript_10364/m.30065 type:complete len:202 (+) Transcript_10364:902-1507(+)
MCRGGGAVPVHDEHHAGQSRIGELQDFEGPHEPVQAPAPSGLRQVPQYARRDGLEALGALVQEPHHLVARLVSLLLGDRLTDNDFVGFHKRSLAACDALHALVLRIGKHHCGDSSHDHTRCSGLNVDVANLRLLVGLLRRCLAVCHVLVAVVSGRPGGDVSYRHNRRSGLDLANLKAPAAAGGRSRASRRGLGRMPRRCDH